MTVTELIARAAKRLIDGDPQLLGVRVCPVTVSPGEVEPLRKELQERLGKATYVALSIPGAKTVNTDRLFVSADHSAAERATLWRNEVKVDEGEHLIYVSVRVHGKAGGLQDCLTPLREADLRAEFELWCDEKGSGMPPGLGSALRESGILDRASALSLCEYATAVQRDRRESKWEGAGHHLPLLNLARDTGLRASTAAVRLEENERVVSRAATGERAASVTSGPTAQLREAFRAEAGDVQERLKRVDLTEHLASAAGRKKTRGKEKVQRPAKKATSAKAQKKTTKPALNPNAALVEAANSDSKDTLGDLERRAKKLERDASPESVNGTAPERGGRVSNEDQPIDPVWTKAQQASEFGALADRIPLGLGSMLLKSLQSDGYGLRWSARESASALLDDLPPQLAPTEVRWEISDGAVRAALQRVIECRRAAVQLLVADSGLRPLSTFIASPLVALADRAVRAAMIALVDASAELFAAVAKSPDGAGRRTVLALDTVEVRAKSGDAVLVVGPLHPLWLSQALGRFDALLTQRDLSATAKRLLVRSLSEAPVAPDQWPADGSAPLQSSRPIGGLISYKSAADDLEPKDVAETVARVVALFVDSLPHARLGLRVAVLGDDAGPVIDGIAVSMEEHPEITKVAVHHRGAGQTGQSDKAERAVASGRLILGSLTSTKDALGGDLKPHIVFRLIPASAPGVTLQPAAPVQAGLGASSGLLPTEFTVVESGLRARTPIDVARFPALSAFEAVHALVSGSQPQGAFIKNAWAVSLRALLTATDVPSVSWDVVMAPRIGRRAPEQRFLLSHECPTEQLSVAIVSRDIAPAARALKGAFKALGVEDLRPNVLNSLAVHLASVTSQGIMSPQRSGEQVLAASVLGMALRKELSGGEAFVAHLDGGSAATLLGQPPSSLAGAFAIGFGAEGDKLRVVLGYAALRDAVDADASRGQLSGQLHEVLARLAGSVELATSVDGVGAVAAREALNWLLWPALAAAERPNSKTEQLLLHLNRGVACKLSVVAYLPPSSPALKRGTGGTKLGAHPVGLHALDVGTFEALVFGGGAVAKAR
jgi:hypothetical protein